MTVYDCVLVLRQAVADVIFALLHNWQMKPIPWTTPGGENVYLYPFLCCSIGDQPGQTNGVACLKANRCCTCTLYKAADTNRQAATDHMRSWDEQVAAVDVLLDAVDNGSEEEAAAAEEEAQRLGLPETLDIVSFVLGIANCVPTI